MMPVTSGLREKDPECGPVLRKHTMQREGSELNPSQCTYAEAILTVTVLSQQVKFYKKKDKIEMYKIKIKK